MPYLQNFQWDIFISYAHAEFPDVQGASSWIKNFVDLLARELNKASGEHFEIFFDDRSQPLNAEIEHIPEDVASSAILLAIGSNNYAKSKWCEVEAKTFHFRSDDASRVFIAEYMRLRDDLDYPLAIPNNRRQMFWYDDERKTRLNITPRMQMFKIRVAALAQAIWDRLSKMNLGNVSPTEKAEDAGDESHDLKTVFLAFATDDVIADRIRVRDYLEGKGVTVLPKMLLPPGDPRRYRALIEKDLRAAEVFVQLLGKEPDVPVDGIPEGYALHQYRAAIAEGGGDLTMLHWRARHARPETAGDAAYRALLESAQAGSLTQFNKEIFEAAQPGKPDSGPRSIFINADEPDSDHALDLIEVCADLNEFAELGNSGLDPSSLRKRYATAAMVTLLYGSAGRKWVQSQVDIFARAWAEAEDDRKPPLLIYLAPPEDKGPDGPKPGRARLPFAVPALHVIDTRQEWSVKPFADVIKGLR